MLISRHVFVDHSDSLTWKMENNPRWIPSTKDVHENVFFPFHKIPPRNSGTPTFTIMCFSLLSYSISLFFGLNPKKKTTKKTCPTCTSHTVANPTVKAMDHGSKLKGRIGQDCQ